LFDDNPSSALLNGGSGVGFPSINIEGGRIQFSSINGKLLVCINTNYVWKLEYDPDTDAISTSTVTLQVRDIWGVEDGLGVEERPTTFSASHRYNLFNQGWYLDDIICVPPSSVYPMYDSFWIQHGKRPSNADIWYFGKRASAADNFYADDVIKQGFGNTPAPKGHYIINAFFRSDSRYSESLVSGLDDDYTDGGLNVIASFAGRMFYSGVKVSEKEEISTTPRLETFIFFSKVVETDEDLGKCYQLNDPTAEIENEIIDSDGGTIPIPEISGVTRLVPVGRELLVLAENGVWSISGSESGFSATNFQVSKISDIGVSGADSIVVAETVVLYWSKAGIYSISIDEATGRYTLVRNITETTIQSLYTAIPAVARAKAVGVYDGISRRVRWMYNDDDDYTGLSNTNRYNKELIFDVVLGAFTKNTLIETTTGPFVAAYVVTPNFNTTDQIFDIVEGVDDIVEGADDVVQTTTSRSNSTSTIKYLTIKQGTTHATFTLSHFWNADFLDWYTEDSTGTDATAYLETGYFIGGDTQRDKSVKYMTAHFNRTESGYVLDGNGNQVFDTPSGCLARAKWDFSDHVGSGRWSSQFQAYRLNRLYIPEDVNDPFDYGFSVVTTKNKIRGYGKAFRLRLDSEPAKDLYLLGWGLLLQQEDEP
jgi:hypothetical protein